jgi:hypothetical protein
VPLLKHKADDDAAYQQQQQLAWVEHQSINRPSTSHPTAAHAAPAPQRPPRPNSVAGVPNGSSSRVEAASLYGGTDGFKWGGPTSGLDESLLLPSCSPAPPRQVSGSAAAAESSANVGGTGAATSARKPSPLGSPIPQQVTNACSARQLLRRSRAAAPSVAEIWVQRLPKRRGKHLHEAAAFFTSISI